MVSLCATRFNTTLHFVFVSIHSILKEVHSVLCELRTGSYNTGLFEMIVGVLTASFSRRNPMWFLSIGLRQGSGLCSSSSRRYPGNESTNQNRHWNHHGWHGTNSIIVLMFVESQIGSDNARSGLLPFGSRWRGVAPNVQNTEVRCGFLRNVSVCCIPGKNYTGGF